MPAVRPLPMQVPLVRTETLDSYLSRIAAANHLDPRDLRAHLGMRTRTQPPDLDRLATMTGHPVEQLSGVVADACPPPGRSRLARLTGRVACRHCTAGRGICGDVYCVNPDQRVCRRHRRWLGGPTDNTAFQHDVTPLPDLTQAQRRHTRLLRDRGAGRGRDAIYWAGTIVDHWTERGAWGEHRQRRLAAHLAANPSTTEPDTDLLHMANYPEVVALASVLASPHWSAIASADYRRGRLSFDVEVARRLNLAPTGFASSDPLITWQEGHAHVRRLQLHEQPGYRGPEIWLAGTC